VGVSDLVGRESPPALAETEIKAHSSDLKPILRPNHPSQEPSLDRKKVEKSYLYPLDKSRKMVYNKVAYEKPTTYSVITQFAYYILCFP
jgi:hypothetical protein